MRASFYAMTFSVSLPLKLLVVIFCSLVELEDSKADKGEMSRILKAKETKILSQQAKIDDHENRIVQLENE